MALRTGRPEITENRGSICPFLILKRWQRKSPVYSGALAKAALIERTLRGPQRVKRIFLFNAAIATDSGGLVYTGVRHIRRSSFSASIQSWTARRIGRFEPMAQTTSFYKILKRNSKLFLSNLLWNSLFWNSWKKQYSQMFEFSLFTIFSPSSIKCYFFTDCEINRYCVSKFMDLHLPPRKYQLLDSLIEHL